MKAFFLKLGGVAAVLAGVIYLLAMGSTLNGFLSFTWWAWAFLTVLTVLVYGILHYSFAMKSNSHFMATFGVAMATKFFCSLIFLSYFIFIDPIANTNFIFPFFVMYFVYTGLLIVQITWGRQ